MERTKIAWCDHTFNPWVGCGAVSEGCVNCYARVMTERWQGKGAFERRRRTSEELWRKPLKWEREAAAAGRRVRVFCGSMCDWLDPAAEPAWLSGLLALVERTPHVDWLLLTKRPEVFGRRMMAAIESGPQRGSEVAAMWLRGEPPANVWFGVTAENQERWDERVNLLRGIPARLKWVSVEPMLGAVCPRVSEADDVTVDWVVAGGENGRGARTCRREWIVRLCGRCGDLEMPFFWKQWGSRAEGLEEKGGLKLTAGITENVREWPAAMG